MAAYGTHIGTAFQLIDDVLDYSGSAVEMGKNVGDDLGEGKATLPLIHAMRNGSADEASRVRVAIEHGGIDDLTPVLDAIRHSGAIEYTRAQAEAEARLACAKVAHLPRSKHLETLLELARFAVERSF